MPGKNLTVADTLSRAPATSPTSEEMQFSSSVEAYVNLMLQRLQATEKRLQQIQQAHKQDAVCCKLSNIVKKVVHRRTSYQVL